MSRIKNPLVDPLLSVVMPVFNEKATIDEIIRRTLAVPLRVQLIVIDDCSTDGTRDMAERARVKAMRGAAAGILRTFEESWEG